MARTEHPDKKPNDPKANQKFAKINTAYECLSDENKRREYDQQRASPGGGGGGGFGGFGGGPGFGRAETPPEQRFNNNQHIEVMEDDGSERSLGTFRRKASHGFWLVIFFDNESNMCKRIAEAFAEAAGSFHGLIKVMAISYQDEEMSATPLTKMFNVERTGTILLYSPQKAVGLEKPMRFIGDAAKMSEISAFAGNTVPYGGSIVRDHTSLQRFLIKDESKPKFFLLTKQWSVPLIFKLLGMEFGSMISFGVCRGESSSDSFLKRYKPVKRGDRMPILLYFPNGDAKPVKYEGMIAQDDIRKYLSGKVGGEYQGTVVTDHNTLTRFLIRNDARPKLLLITNKEDTPLLWKALSNQWKDKVDFAACRVAGAQSSSFIMKRYKVKKVPQIVFFAHGDAKPVLYDGATSKDGVNTFLVRNGVSSW